MDIKKFADALPLLQRIRDYIKPPSSLATGTAELSYSDRLRLEADLHDRKMSDFDAFDVLVKELESEKVKDEKVENPTPATPCRVV